MIKVRLNLLGRAMSILMLFANCFKIISVVIFLIAAMLVVIQLLRDFGIIKSDIGFVKSLKGKMKEITAHKPFNKANKALKQNESLRALLIIALMVLLSRLIFYLLGYIAILLIKNENVGFLTSFQTIWNKWDSPHYISIAKDGYVNVGDARNFLVFYPLYPSLIKLVSNIIGNYYFSGILVSNISLIVAGFYMYKLTLVEAGGTSAFNAVKYMLIYPFSFFLGIVYTESLFLALTIMTFYFIRKRSWLTAGICGFLTVLTRNQGILLLVPAIVEYLSYIYEVRSDIRNNNSNSIKDIIKKGMCLLVIPLGTLVYLYINKLVTGEWFEFLKIQKEHWHNGFGFFGENLKNHFLNIFSYDPSMRISLWLPQVISFIFAIAITLYGMKKLRASYTAYMLTYIFICFSPTWLLSGPRYISGLFPIYILLAIFAKNKATDNVFTAVSSIFLCFYTIAYAIGANVM